ncbi:hypothetical protein [Haladaptatus pallidirubidus]|nr:hypothetical protein [Haladaptatus pallidirubidus]
MTGDALAYTCLLHVHRDAICKHMAAVENATVDGTLEAFPTEDECISGPYTGYDKYGNIDHNYRKCEHCGAEATRKDTLTDCC